VCWKCVCRLGLQVCAGVLVRSMMSKTSRLLRAKLGLFLKSSMMSER
jgi:hypothetical protein